MSPGHLRSLRMTEWPEDKHEIVVIYHWILMWGHNHEVVNFGAQQVNKQMGILH